MMINIDEFLTPISKNRICGEDLKYEYIYDQIKEFRREDDPRLSQGVWLTEPKKANWKEVRRICSHLLKTKTKDLQIAMWFLESMIALEGFQGLNQGLILILALCEKFWDDIYPSIDWENQNFMSRLSPFYFLAEKIQEKIVLIPIMESTDGLVESYSLSDWMTARHNLQIKNNKGLSLKQLKKNILSTPIEFFKNLETEVKLSAENLKKLNEFVGEKCSNDAPSFRGIFDCLSDVERIISHNLSEKKSQMEKNSSDPQIKQDDDKTTTENSASRSKEIPQSKPSLEQVYNNLNEIAVFLEKEQPQSPASTLIKIAVEIGKKSFQELLEINIKSGLIVNTISELYRMLAAAPENK
ncbi:MAG: type VI secretion system protein TssA [Holosporaceae bacterium]|jgi:type VI secretion system protein ImpA|nr:type VI secretion system protein TssA [Holosporaceae bacterium]